MRLPRIVLTLASAITFIVVSSISVPAAHAVEYKSASIWVSSGYLKFAGACEYTSRQHMVINFYIEKKAWYQSSSSYQTYYFQQFDIGWVSANVRVSRSGTGPQAINNSTTTYRSVTSCMYYDGYWKTKFTAYSGGI